MARIALGVLVLLVVVLGGLVAVWLASPGREPWGPPIGHELTSVAGVSVVRTPATTGRWLETRIGGGRGYGAWHGYTARDLVELASRVGARETIVKGDLPAGDYTVTVGSEAVPSEDVYGDMWAAICEAFELEVTRNTVPRARFALRVRGGTANGGATESAVAALPAGLRRSSSFRGTSASTESTGGRNAMELDGPISALATHLEDLLDRPVEDVTGLDGAFSVHLVWYDGERDGGVPPGLARSLASQGLELRREVVETEILTVESEAVTGR